MGRLWFMTSGAGIACMLSVAQASAGTSGAVATWEDMLPEITQRVVASGVRLVFLGDSHSRENHKQALADLLLSLHAADPAFNCILDELDPTWFQRAVDDTLGGAEPYATLGERVFQSAPAFIQDSYGHDYFVKKMPETLPEYIFDALTTAGARMLGIDLPKTEDYITFMQEFPNPWLGQVASPAHWDERNRIQMIERNTHMEARITEALQDGRCTKAIVFVGADHLTQFGKLGLTDEEVVPVPRALAGTLPSQTIYLFMDDDAKEKYERTRGPNAARGGLQHIPLSELTYTPTILRW